jgi:hypothetical protein
MGRLKHWVRRELPPEARRMTEPDLPLLFGRFHRHTARITAELGNRRPAEAARPPANLRLFFARQPHLLFCRPPNVMRISKRPCENLRSAASIGGLPQAGLRSDRVRRLPARVRQPVLH